MAVGDGWTSQLIANMAQHLDDNSVGVWRPTGSYADSEIAILDRRIVASPDRIITIATYPLTNQPGSQDHAIGMQFRLRGTVDPRVVADLGDALYELLHACGHITLGDIQISDITWTSQAGLGEDALGRWEASHNYNVAAMRAAAHLTD